MADLNITKSESTHLWEDAGQNMIPNNGFEDAPSFTAATNTNQRWIDGTAAGSLTDDVKKWALANLSGTVSTRFDTSEFHSGTGSMKLSLGATNSTINVDIARRLNNSTDVIAYGVPILSSTAYVVAYWLKVNVTSGSSRGAYIRVAEYNSAGSAGLTRDGTFISTTTAWTRYTISFTSASTAAFLTFQLTLSGTVAPATLLADVWFDDLTLTKAANNIDLTIGPIVTPGIQDISGPKIWG